MPTPDADDSDVKMEPRTIACAIKGVYASLWNKRAIEERTFLENVAQDS